MKLTFKQFLSEAKYAHQNKDVLLDELTELVFSAFYDERNYIGDFDTPDEYAREAVDNLDSKLREVIPQKHVTGFIDAAWNSFHDLNIQDFADTDSYVDAVINDVLREFNKLMRFIEI